MRHTAVAVNEGMEQTGSSGSLPDSEYNINCPAYPGPSFKLNYLAESCAIRLKNETCDQFDCPRFEGRIRKVKVISPPAQGKKNGRPKMKNRKRPCADCGKKVIPKGRELCSICYGRHKWAGTILNFPTSNELRRLAKTSKKES